MAACGVEVDLPPVEEPAPVLDELWVELEITEIVEYNIPCGWYDHPYYYVQFYDMASGVPKVRFGYYSHRKVWRRTEMVCEYLPGDYIVVTCKEPGAFVINGIPFWEYDDIYHYQGPPGEGQFSFFKDGSFYYCGYNFKMLDQQTYYLE